MQLACLCFSRLIQAPQTDTMYRTITANQRIISAQRKLLNSVSSAIEKLQLNQSYRSTPAQSPASTTPGQAKDGQVRSGSTRVSITRIHVLYHRCAIVHSNVKTNEVVYLLTPHGTACRGICFSVEQLPCVVVCSAWLRACCRCSSHP